jgi:hypothetical protein
MILILSVVRVLALGKADTLFVKDEVATASPLLRQKAALFKFLMQVSRSGPVM